MAPVSVAIRDRIQVECSRAQARLTAQSPAVVGWLVGPRITHPARTLLEKAPGPRPEIHVLELELARLPPRGWVVRRGPEMVLPAR